MKKYEIVIVIILAMILLSHTKPLSGTEILLWDNDNASYIDDPEGAGIVGCEYAIQQALTANDEDFTTLTYLPMDLSGYDVIFITLGHWCPG